MNFSPTKPIEISVYKEMDWAALEKEYQSICCENHQINLSADIPQWADELARLWLEVLQYIYQMKKAPEEQISREIVALQAQTFVKPLERIFQEVEWDSPDEVLREILKNNLWDFSVAKNYNDVLAVNNLLLKEDGSLRAWHDFKYQAQKVVGRSVRYLKTEYNTIVASAQMSRKWQEIQRDKHLFPFVQFKVVQDKHTSDTCKPLHNVIVTTDDPMLAYYFPPNHFNCRTDVISLRRATPTQRYNLPQIPEAFKNNPAISGKIFTEKHPYFLNTPQEVLKQGGILQKADLLSKPREEQFKKLFETENGGQVLEHLLAKKGDDYDDILRVAKEFSKEGKMVEIMPEISEKDKSFRDLIFPNLNSSSSNPDLKLGEVYFDIKRPEAIKNILGNANKASKQGAIAIITDSRLDKELTEQIMKERAKDIFRNKNYLFDEVIFFVKGKLIVYNRTGT